MIIDRSLIQGSPAGVDGLPPPGPPQLPPPGGPHGRQVWVPDTRSEHIPDGSGAVVEPVGLLLLLSVVIET